MKRMILVVAALCCSLVVLAQSGPTDVERIQAELDRIMKEASTLPPEKQSAISSSVLSIQRIIGSASFNQTNATFINGRMMSDQQFASFVESIKKATWFNEQLQLISRTSRRTYFQMAQIKTLLLLFPFNSERDKVRDVVVPRAIDPENVGLLYDIYVFPSEQKKLNDLLD